MKNKASIVRRMEEVRKEIMTSNYGYGRGWAEANTEYRALCWVLNMEIEDLSKIKNDYLLATIIGQ